MLDREEDLFFFVDSEGKPTQELADILFDTFTQRVKDMYLQYASLSLDDTDWFTRRHVHGLNRI